MRHALSHKASLVERHDLASRSLIDGGIENRHAVHSGKGPLEDESQIGVTAPLPSGRGFRRLTPRLQPESQNVQGGVVVPIFFHPATRTGIRPIGQGHFLPMAAGRTGLGRIGRIHLPELPTGTFSPVREKGEELRPRRISDASVQASVGVHVVDGDVFHKNSSVLIDDLSGFLMSKIRPLKCDSLMDPGNYLSSFNSFFRALLLKLRLPLLLSQPSGRLLEEFRIFDDGSIRERRKGLVA